jgi:hypothetical protein
MARAKTRNLERLTALLMNRRDISRMRKEYEEQERELSAEILGELDALGLQSGSSLDVGIPGESGMAFRTSISVRVSSKILPERLLEKGVDVKIIKYATEEKESAPFVMVREVKA